MSHLAPMVVATAMMDTTSMEGFVFRVVLPYQDALGVDRPTSASSALAISCELMKAFASAVMAALISIQTNRRAAACARMATL